MSGSVTLEFIDMRHHWCTSEIHPLPDVVLVLGHFADPHGGNVPPIATGAGEGSADRGELASPRLEPLFIADR